MLSFLALLPWLALVALQLGRMHPRPRLMRYPPETSGDAPLVSIIVPARDEAENLGPCIATLMSSTYPNYEVIVVDDGSSDGTEAIARALAERGAGRIRLVAGRPLPPGWIGKSWACWQGYQVAHGELLLFTDADTRHDPDLLPRAVRALRDEGAGLLSVLPRQLLKSFWERVIMPHFFFLILTRYGDLRRMSSARRARDVIANGQLILIRRSLYEAIGGHEGVRGEVVEDLRLAQRAQEAGGRVFLAHAEPLMETRMYRSLGGILEGWSKNLAQGSRAAAPPLLAPLVPWLAPVALLVLWVAPPLLLALDWGGRLHGWALPATAASVVFWAITSAQFKVPVLYALTYPLGAVIAALLFLRSALRGDRTQWRGRAYRGDTHVSTTEG